MVNQEERVGEGEQSQVSRSHPRQHHLSSSSSSSSSPLSPSSPVVTAAAASSGTASTTDSNKYALKPQSTSGEWHFSNTSQPLPQAGLISGQFTIQCPPGTDIWSRPPNIDSIDSPILHKTGPLSQFRRVSAHITGAFSADHDMGGIIMILHNKRTGQRKWIKSGLEHYGSRRNVSVVTKQEFADWSLFPYDHFGVTLEMRREKTGSLWVYLVVGIQRVPIREVTWVFEGEEDVEVMAGAYASRPTKTLSELTVVFKQLEVLFFAE
ncbi:hypothetical protein KEM54_002556 [Ascosphaera aggregata]|nr:hypothetical protein KEM54_002556 [Ascosphaera aggregata]